MFKKIGNAGLVALLAVTLSIFTIFLTGSLVYAQHMQIQALLNMQELQFQHLTQRQDHLLEIQRVLAERQDLTSDSVQNITFLGSQGTFVESSDFVFLVLRYEHGSETVTRRRATPQFAAHRENVQ